MPPSRSAHGRFLAGALGIGLASGLIWAGAALAAPSAGNQFNVAVRLLNPGGVPAVPASAFCRVGPTRLTFGAIVTVVCATGAVVNVESPPAAVHWAPLHGGAYRFNRLADEVQGVEFPGTIDSYIGLGTVTSWRWVTLPNRDYLELQLGW